MAEKTKQELIIELAKLRDALYEARKFYHNKGVFIDLESRIQKVHNTLIESGVTAEEIEHKLKNSLF